MEKLCDLHTHSVFSDGTDTPRAIARAAKAQGLSCVALTDHNTVLGLSEFESACLEEGIIGVPGVEFSVDHKGTELHLLGLFIKKESYPSVDALLQDVLRWKEEANEDLARALLSAGYDIDYESIRQKSGGYVNRAHFATEMMEKGYALSVREAFNTYLKSDRGFYKDPKRPDFIEVVGFIRKIGAVPVLAHPFLNLTEEELIALLPCAREAGLAGIETDYSTYSEKMRVRARAIADEYGILRSGGSDYHGKRKPDISLGDGKGDLAVPYSYYEDLKKEAVN